MWWLPYLEGRYIHGRYSSSRLLSIVVASRLNSSVQAHVSMKALHRTVDILEGSCGGLIQYLCPRPNSAAVCEVAVLLLYIECERPCCLAACLQYSWGNIASKIIRVLSRMDSVEYTMKPSTLREVV